MKQFLEICVESHPRASGSVLLGLRFEQLHFYKTSDEHWRVKTVGPSLKAAINKPENIVSPSAAGLFLSSGTFPDTQSHMSPFTPSLILGSLTSCPFSHGCIIKLCGLQVSKPPLLRPLRRAEGTEAFRNNMFRVHSFYGLSHNGLLIGPNYTEVIYTQGGKGGYLLTISGCSHSKN